MYFRILFFSFFKNFVLIITALMFFFVFIDYMLNFSKLPDSINLEVLYIFYNSMNASILIYPLTLIFATLVTILNLVKTNEMIAFLSIGYSPRRLLLPIMTASFLITAGFIGSQSIINVSFSDKARAILSGDYFRSHKDDNLFFKYQNTVIYMKKLDVNKKIAYDMKLFVLNAENKLIDIYEIKKAKFINDIWKSDKIIKYTLTNKEFIKNRVYVSLLKGFKPNILNKLEARKAMSLKVAVQALYLFKAGRIDLNFIKTYIYNAIIPPLSFILLTILVILHTPIHPRISNIPKYVFISIFSSILLWGMFLLVQKMSTAGVITPEIAFFTPFLILLGLTIYYFRKI